MPGEDNTVCLNLVIDFKDNRDPEAWIRVLSAITEVIESEGASAGGGMHPYGTTINCCKLPWWDIRRWLRR